MKATIAASAVALLAGCASMWPPGHYLSNTCKPQLGMTGDQVREMCGKPGNVYRTTTSSGVSEQWRYGRPFDALPVHYFYFDNGKLTAIQD